MYTRASNSELVEPLEEPERTLNRRLRRQNGRVPFERRDERPKNLREAVNRVVAPTPGPAITTPATANELAIKGNHLTLIKGNKFDGRVKTDPHKHIHEFLGACDMFKYGEIENEAVRLMMFPLSLTGIFLYKTLNQAYQLLEDKVLLKLDWAKNQKPKALVRKTVAFADEDNSNSDIDKIMAIMDAMTMKMDAQYKEMKSRTECNHCGGNHSTADCNNDDTPMSRDEEAKFMQTFRRTQFYNYYRDRDSNRDNWRLSGRNDYNRDYYRSNTDDKPDIQKQLSDFIKSQQSTNDFVKETFMDLKTKLETTTKNHQASIQNLESKFDRLADKQSARPFESLPSNTQPNPRGNPPKPYTPPQARNEQVNAVFTRSGRQIIPIPIGIAENMLVEVGKFTFPVDFIILEMEEDNKVPLILGRHFLHTADAVIRVKQKQLKLGVGSEQMVFSIDSAMKHSYSNDDTCFSIDVIDEILEEEFDALLDEGSKILYSIEATPLEDKIFAEFIAMNIDENTEPEINEEEITFKKITFDTYYKIKKSLDKPPTDLELKHLLDHLEYAFLEEPSFLPIPIDPMDQEKTTFTCPFGTYAYRRMPFGLCNAPATFQRCMLAMFHDMIEEYVEVFMDHFFVFGNSFDNCLHNLDKMLKRCKDASLVLNWEKCHFMVKEGIVLGHKVSGASLEVDKAKIDIISKLPPPLMLKALEVFWDMPDSTDVS
ncbi:reverse transcriptase domain-containing protein [Tanacetum coccineum]